MERAYEQADRLNLLDINRLARECARRPGARVLHALMAEGREAPRSKTELERALLDVCRGHGIPLPSLNVVVHGFEVDAYWPEQKLVVELDSYEWHKTRKAFENDRYRGAYLERREIRVLRFTWRQLTREAATVATTIQARRRAVT